MYKASKLAFLKFKSKVESGPDFIKFSMYKMYPNFFINFSIGTSTFFNCLDFMKT